MGELISCGSARVWESERAHVYGVKLGERAHEKESARARAQEWASALQGGEDAQNALTCRSLLTKAPPISFNKRAAYTGLWYEKWPIKMYIQDESECFNCRNGHFCVAGKKQEVFFDYGSALIVSPPQYLLFLVCIYLYTYVYKYFFWKLARTWSLSRPNTCWAITWSCQRFLDFSPKIFIQESFRRVLSTLNVPILAEKILEWIL